MFVAALKHNSFRQDCFPNSAQAAEAESIRVVTVVQNVRVVAKGTRAETGLAVVPIASLVVAAVALRTDDL